MAFQQRGVGAISACIAALFLTAAPAYAEGQVCYGFQSDATGDYGDEISRFVGLIDGIFIFTNKYPYSPSLEVIDWWASAGNHSLAPNGNPVTLEMWTRLGTSVLPTSFTMMLGAYNGDVDVEAYDASDNLIWSQTYTPGDNVVSIGGVGPIDYVMVLGGDHEVYIDDVCIQ